MQNPIRLELDGHTYEIVARMHKTARRYTLRFTTANSLTLSIPRRGSFAAGVKFAQAQSAWIVKTAAKIRDRPAPPPRHWVPGMAIMFLGVYYPIRVEPSIRGYRIMTGFLPDLHTRSPEHAKNAVETATRAIAARELPARLAFLADQHQLAFKAVSIRNQKTRWGSCSPTRTISLNWRLVQVPEAVRDYIMLHELAHLRHLNHSKAFWNFVASLDPGYEAHEAWLREHPFRKLVQVTPVHEAARLPAPAPAPPAIHRGPQGQLELGLPLG